MEYLTAKVAKAKIDPLPIFDLTDCVQELRRRGIPLPERGPWDTDEIYKNMCAEVRRNFLGYQKSKLTPVFIYRSYRRTYRWKRIKYSNNARTASLSHTHSCAHIIVYNFFTHYSCIHILNYL